MQKNNPKLTHLWTLAEQEGLSVEEFLQKYDGWADTDDRQEDSEEGTV